jgi:hypothetical protein
MDIKQKDFYYQRSSVWKKFQEVGLKHAVHLHDIFETVLSLGDVISDIVIIYGWYQIPSAVNYSYAGMVILALSQCVYTWLILLQFDCPQAPLYAKRIGLIVVGLLFGQLYPTVLLLKSRGYLAEPLRKYILSSALTFSSPTVFKSRRFGSTSATEWH